MTLAEIRKIIAGRLLDPTPTREIGNPSYEHDRGYRLGWNDATKRALRLLARETGSSEKARKSSKPPPSDDGSGTPSTRGR